MMIRRLPPTVRAEIEQTLTRAGIRPGMTVRASAAGNADGDIIRWRLTTEQPVTVWDWDRYEFVREILLVDGIRTPDQVPLLDSHARWSVDDLLGSVSGFTAVDAEPYRALDGDVLFAADDKSARTKQKVLDHHLTDGSVGYSVDRKIWIPAKESAVVAGRTFVGPVKVSYRSTLKEFSATPIGADTLAKVRRLAVPGGNR